LKNPFGAIRVDSAFWNDEAEWCAENNIKVCKFENLSYENLQ